MPLIVSTLIWGCSAPPTVSAGALAVDRAAGVFELTVPAPDTTGSLELRVSGPDPIRTPLRTDPARPGVLRTRLTLPSGTDGGPRIELWSRAGDDWRFRGIVEPVEPDRPAISRVPGWAQGMVWYQVFPERFRNANPDNDPYAWDRTVLAWDAPFDGVTTEEIEMLWNRRLVDPRFFSNDPDRWAGTLGAVGQVIFQRRYGGDLQGVVEQLDHIAGLGATGLYLCPVFEARSLHKYEASDHRHVDPTLGHPGTPGPVDRSGEDPLDETTWGWEPADRYLVDVLLPEARSRGLRVILDGVWNHTGTDHFAFRDVLEKGRDSAYADWFKVEFDDDGRVVWYDAWDRPNGALPEFRQTPEGDLAPGPKAHVYAVTRRWMDPNGDGDPGDGIDGWRLDVAPEIGRAFWRDWRALVRSINPDAVLVGEIWADAGLWFDGVAFDAQMHYPLAEAVAGWLSIDRDATDAAGFADRVRAAVRHHPSHNGAQMTLIASHDTERGASLMANDFARAFDRDAEPWDEGSVYDRGPVDADARRRQLAAYALLVALPGAPMIYNGDEFALPGADDPDNRRPIPWPDLDPRAGPDGAADEGFAARVAGLMGWRSEADEDLLRLGAWEIDAAGGDGVVVRRWLGDRMAEIAVARSGAASFGEVPDGWGVVETRDGFAEWGIRYRGLRYSGVR